LEPPANPARFTIEHLSDNDSAYTAKDTRLFAQAINLTPCFTPVASPQSNGMSEAFVKTLKRDYIRISPLPDADTALRQIDGWIEDYNEIHPHSALKMASPRQFIRLNQPSRLSGETVGTPWANIPVKSNRKASFPFSAWVYRQRNLVERFFSKLIQFRAIATRLRQGPLEFRCGRQTCGSKNLDQVVMSLRLI
jgi:hypothetical protein